MAFTPDSVMAEAANLADAKAIVRDVRATAIAVATKYGIDHPIAREFSKRYDDYVDAMIERFAA